MDTEVGMVEVALAVVAAAVVAAAENETISELER